MARKRGEGEQTKLFIAEKAKQLFSQKGYAATSMEDICGATGLSKGSVYYHFSGKEDLFLFLWEMSWKDLFAQWEQASQGLKSVTEKLYVLAEKFADDFQSPLQKAAEEFAGSRLADQEVLQRLLEIIRSPYQVCEDLFRQGIANGELIEADPKDLTYIFLGLLGGLGTAYYEMDHDHLKQLYFKATTIFLEGAQRRP